MNELFDFCALIPFVLLFIVGMQMAWIVRDSLRCIRKSYDILDEIKDFQKRRNRTD